MVFLHQKKHVQNIEQELFQFFKWILPHWSSETASLLNILPPAAALNVLVAELAPTEATSRTNHKAVGKPNGRRPKIVQKSRKKYICFVMEQDVWSVGQFGMFKQSIALLEKISAGSGWPFWEFKKQNHSERCTSGTKCSQCLHCLWIMFVRF